MMTNDDGGFDPARLSLASVPDPGGSSDNAGAGFPSNDWGDEEDQEEAEEYHDGQYYEGEDGYEYGDDGDDDDFFASLGIISVPKDEPVRPSSSCGRPSTGGGAGAGAPAGD